MQRYFKTISLALLLAALFVLFSTSSVFADDGGTSGETPAAAEPGIGEPVQTEAPVMEATPLPEGTAAESAVVEEPLPTETPALEETPPSDESLALDEELILADEAGDPLVLASEETAALLRGGDPYFIVGTQKYAWVFDIDGLPGWQSDCPAGTTPGTTCFQATGTGTIAEVLNFIDTNGLVPTDKKIYVEAGTYDESAAGVFIDGTSSVFLKQLNGLIGVNGSENTTIIGDVTVAGTTAGFTLSGFTIQGGVTIASVTGSTVLNDLDVKNTSGDGVLVIDQRGGVTVSGVATTENLGVGLVVDNSTTTTAYPVTITNSEVEDNGQGTFIYSNGAVTVDGVSSSRNGGDGMVIETRGAVTVKNGVFSNNTLVDVGNYEGWGGGLFIRNQAAIAPVTLENIQAKGNEDAGIWVWTIGPVTVKNVTAAYNGYQGLLVTDDYWNGSTQSSTTVSISDSSFNNNTTEGLRVHAKGNVTFSYVNATYNSNEGAIIDTCLFDGIKCLGAGSVTILNPYQTTMDFSFNGIAGTFDGLDIYAAGAVTITGISARVNTGSGLYVVNNFPGKTGGVTLNSLPEVLGYPQQSKFDANGLVGLEVFSNGPVAINGKSSFPMRMNNNTQGGIIVGDHFNPSGSTVKITGVNLSNTGDTAVTVYSKGAITIDSVWVDQSWSESYGGSGFNLNNTFGSGGVTISNAAANYVDAYGFYITSKGAVTLTSVSVYQPGQRGIYIDNSSVTTAQPVKLTDVTVERAHGNGIEILSKGTVTLNGVDSFNNSGMMLPQYQSIDLSGYAVDQTWFNFLGESGAQISITMNYTGYAAMELYDASNGDLLWSDESGYWSDPFESGILTLPTTGEYYLSMVWNSDWQDDYTYLLNYRYNATIPYANSAPYNTGIYIDNSFGSADVIIQGSSKNPNPRVSNNTNAGIFVRSAGNIKLMNTSLHRNQRDGATLDNSIALTSKTVTAGSLDIYRSGWVGLRITSIGAVTMSNISSNENGSTGIEVVNCLLDSGACKGSGAVSLTGTNAISNNGEFGLNIYTIGLVTLNNIDAYGNVNTGIFISAPASGSLTVIPASGGVTMTSTGGFINSIGNTYEGVGLYIYTYGPVTLTNLDVYENQSSGIMINNRYAATNKPVTLTNVNVSRSGSTGIDIKSRGTVTINGVTSTSNAYKDASIGYGETIEGLGNGDLYFWFDVPDAVELVIDFNSDTFLGEIQLYDQYWNWLGTAVVDSDDPVSIDAGIVSGGTYFVEMWPWYTTPFGYRLSVSDHEGIVDRDFTFPASGITIDNTYGTGDVLVGKSSTGKTNRVTENTGYGLGIFTNGNIRLGSTYVARNFDQGIYIQSMTEAKTTTITDITVEDNHNHGMTLITLGAVNWTTGMIRNNDGYGVMINDMSSAAAPVTLTKVKIYGSHGQGLNIYAKGAVTLTDVDAIDNHENGITVTTSGAITLNRVNATANYDPENSYIYGAYLDNSSSASLTPAGVSITDSNFNYNNFGLYVNSKGAVTLKGVDVEGNYDRGHTINLDSSMTANLPGFFKTDIDNYGLIYGGNEASWVFTVTEIDYDLALDVYLDFDGYWDLYDSDGNSLFADYYDGDDVPHYILQPGDYRILLHAYMFADGGMYHIGLNVDSESAFPSSYANGVEINTEGNVIIARSTARPTNNFNRNGWNGVRIYTDGSITMSDIKANENLYAGINLNSPVPGKPITVNRTVVLDNYYKNAQVYAAGAISWTTGESSGSLYGAMINNSGAATAQPVTITKVSFNKAVNGYGVEIYSTGNVLLTSVGGMWNRWSGIYIDNTTGTGSVTVNNTTGEWIGVNGSDGLTIYSKGTVTLTNVGTGRNSGNGIYVNNQVSSGTVKPGVTLVYTLERWVDSNQYRGLDIHSSGLIKLTTTKNLYIEYNGTDGVYLDNSVGGTAVGVTTGGVQATSTSKPGQMYFTSHNGGYGLVVFTQGPAVLSNISSNDTLYHAILVGDDFGVGKPSSVKLTNITVQGAGSDSHLSDGIRISAAGPVWVDKIQSVFPYGDGLDITSTSGDITVKRAYMWSNGNNDSGYGIRIHSNGNVILDSIISSRNDRSLYVDTSGSFTLLGTYYKNEFNDSFVGDSITINAGAGGITLNRLDVINNNGGVVLTTTGKITINNALIQNNRYGINGQAGSGAAINKVISLNNGVYDSDGDRVEEFYATDGIFLQIDSGSVTFTDSVFVGNTGSGIEIYFADPAITAKPYPLTLLRTLYYGNDSDFSGDLNLYTRDA